MASPTLITPTSNPKPIIPTRPRSSAAANSNAASSVSAAASPQLRRRELLSLIPAAGLFSAASAWLAPAMPALAASDDEYVKESEEVISKVKSAMNMDRNDPHAADVVADLRQSSNTWVAKYRREKALLARASFRDIYSALNAVSGHYISFGPTTPIPAKRKARILEEVETAEKALLRGR